MFAEIVPRYDLLNHVLSLGLDFFWRRALARRLPRGAALCVADLCTGTGDQAAAVARRLGPGGNVVGLDFCGPMIERACCKYGGRAGLEFVLADATQLPLGSDCFDAVTVAFGLRNVADQEAALGEMLRVLRPGGQVLVLEFCRPTGWLWPRIFGFYFGRLVPILGGLVSGRHEAYEYLPTSVERFGPAEALGRRLEGATFGGVTVSPLVGGVAVLARGRKSP